MSTRTDALVSQQETGKTAVSIDPCCGRLSLGAHSKCYWVDFVPRKVVVGVLSSVSGPPEDPSAEEWGILNEPGFDHQSAMECGRVRPAQ